MNKEKMIEDYGFEMTEETIDELTNGKGDDEDELHKQPTE